MLLLTRTTNGQIIIDGNITITILEIRGKQVSIGIAAPREIPIVRGELKTKGIKQ